MEIKEFHYDKLDEDILARLYNESKTVAYELCEKAKLNNGMIVVVGCSTSRILGKNFGKFSHPDAGTAVCRGILDVLNEKGIFLAAQCCEHLNRAIVIERRALPNTETVNVIPQIKAGGSFATAAYHSFSDPVVLEEIRADAGLDIGGTMIGMHLKKVAVPLTLERQTVGDAIVLAARTRPKFIGGVRAVYDERYL